MNRIKIVCHLISKDIREIGSWSLPLNTKEDQDDVMYYIHNELEDPKVAKVEIVKI